MTQPTSADVAIVIPAFNEAATIADVVRGVSPSGRAIVVDDGSTDDTAKLASQAGAVVVRLHVNSGYDGALLAGYQWAADHGFALVASIDADGQHAADTVTHLLSLIGPDGTDMALGVRDRSARLAERIFSAYTRRRFGVPDILCGVKAFRIEVFRRHAEVMSEPSIGTALALAALRDNASFALAPVPVQPRQHGSTRFGGGVRAELRIGRAMLRAIADDVWSWARRRHRPVAAG